jgi:hypothetical protein
MNRVVRGLLLLVVGAFFIAGLGAQQGDPSLAAGDLTLLVGPSYSAAADDVIRTLMHVGLAPYGVPSFSLVESDRLHLVLTYDDYTTAAVALPYREAVWTPGDELELRVVWDFSASNPFFAFLIDGQLVGREESRRVDEFGSPSARLFVGEQWDGTFAFDGRIEVGAYDQRPGISATELDQLPPFVTERSVNSRPEPVEVEAPSARMGAEIHAPPSFDGAGIDDLTPPPRITVDRPPLGGRAELPGYGTILRRLTAATDSGGFATQIYSQLQAFSPDGRFILVTTNTGYRVLELSTGRDMPIDPRGWNAPRWNPAADHEILAFDSNDDTSLALLGTEVDGGGTRTVFQFPARYERIRPSQSFDEVSRDGRWIAGLASISGGDQAIFALDLEVMRLGAEIPLRVLYGQAGSGSRSGAEQTAVIAGRCAPDPLYGVLEPDWIGVSPGGSALVVQWVRDWAPGVGGCSGLEAMSLQTGSYLGRVANGHAHGDLGQLRDGKEVFYTVALSSPEDPNLPSVVYHELPIDRRMDPAEGARPQVFLLTIPWGAAEHLSAQGPPGMVLIGSGAFDPSSGRLRSHPASPFAQELALVFSDGTFRRLGQTRTSACGYWAQARATLSPDGRYVAFASDWFSGTGRTGCEGGDLGSADLYLLETR